MTLMSVAVGQLVVAKRMFSTRQLVHVHLRVSVAGIPFLEKGPVKKTCPAGAYNPKAPLATETCPTATVLLLSLTSFCVRAIEIVGRAYIVTV